MNLPCQVRFFCPLCNAPMQAMANPMSHVNQELKSIQVNIVFQCSDRFCLSQGDAYAVIIAITKIEQPEVKKNGAEPIGIP